MLSSEFIRNILAQSNIHNVTDVINKDQKIFITIEVDSPNNQDLESKIYAVLGQYITKQDLKIIFTNKSSDSSKAKHYINGISKIILVSSGKGGVGKSTIAVSLANKYKQEGYNVGIVDADIYGPSIPAMFGINGKPEIIGKSFIPIDVSGIKLMSVGFLVDYDAPIAWRGPMASKILYQMLSSTKWNENGSTIDYLIVDMPPGTGDVHLSILENYHIDGVVIVTTPQKISMIDVERAIALYRKFNIPILEIVENMSDVFPGSSGEILATKHNITQLTKIKFDKKIALMSDKGMFIQVFER